MQFYQNGYVPGDPDILQAKLPEAVDVLVIGSGPAGALVAAQLSNFPSISTRLIERREGALQVGQADGIACRTVEMFEAFGLGQKLMREAYWVNETVFWRPSKQDRTRIERTGRVQDTEDGLSIPSGHLTVPDRVVQGPALRHRQQHRQNRGALLRRLETG